MIAAFRRHPAWVAALAATGLLLTAACALTAPASRAATPSEGGAATRPAPGSINRNESAVTVPGGAPLVKPPATVTLTEHAAVVSAGGTMTAVNADGSSTSVADQLSLKKLEIPLKEVSFDGVGLANVLDFIRDRTGTNLLVRWKILENAGIDRNSPISLKLGDVTARVALTRVLDDIPAKLGYDVSDGIITVSTQEDILATAKTTTVVYNVRDLLESTRPVPVNGEVVPPAAEPLMAVIRGNVAPQLWVDNGGHLGSINAFDGLFTITATPTMHAQVADLLSRLRAAARESAKSPATPAKSAASSGVSLPPGYPPEGSLPPPTGANASPAKPAPESLRRVYDVHRLIDVPPTQTSPLSQDQRNAVKDLENSITALLDPNARVTSVNGMLIVYTSQEGQEQVERLIIELNEHHSVRMDEAQRARAEAEKAREEANKARMEQGFGGRGGFGRSGGPGTTQPN